MGTENLASVAVVMSTYNGEKYLGEQLNSVLAQDYGNLSIYVRDDGSTDGTMGVLESYEHEGKITLVRGKNAGVVGSFFSLLEMVAGKYDYVAFCDQDDSWYPDKISRAVEVLEKDGEDVPLLYCTEYEFCDGELKRQCKSRLNRRGVGFSTMLYENMVSGNTTLMNDCLVRAVVDAGVDNVYCHDWWCALVAAAVGRLHYDDYACLDYRRTGSNVSATGTGGFALLRFRIKKFLSGDELSKITGQLEKLNTCFASDIPADRLRLLKRFLSGGRGAKMFAPVRLRQKLAEELALRLLFLTGRL